METHVRVLAILQIVFGTMGLLAGLVLLVVFGGAAGIVGTVGVAQDSGALIAVPIIGIVGAVLIGLVVLLSLPSLVAGIGLLNYRPWARIMTMVLSILNLFNVPVGTLLGAYGLWVMLSPETEALCRRGGVPRHPIAVAR